MTQELMELLREVDSQLNLDWPSGLKLRLREALAKAQRQGSVHGEQPAARVNAQGFLVECGDLPLAPGSVLFLAPQPTIPDERLSGDDDPAVLCAYNDGWNACRAAVLAAAPEVKR